MNKKILIFVLLTFSLLVIAGCQETKGITLSNKVAATAERNNNVVNNTAGSGMEEVRLRSNGEYRFLDGGAIKISCNRIRAANQRAFANNTRFLANGSLASGAFAEHNLIPGEYTTAFNKKYSCNR